MLLVYTQMGLTNAKYTQKQADKWERDREIGEKMIDKAKQIKMKVNTKGPR